VVPVTFHTLDDATGMLRRALKRRASRTTAPPAQAESE